MSLIPQLKSSVLEALRDFAAGTDVTGEDPNKATQTGSFTIANTPVIPGTLVLTDSGASGQTITDNGDGTGEGAGGSTFTVDYLTGEVTYSYGAAITEVRAAYSHGPAKEGKLNLADQGHAPYASNMFGFRMTSNDAGATKYVVEVKVSKLPN